MNFEIPELPANERRFLPAAAPEATGRTVSGTALLFETRSENLGTRDRPWFEVIARDALPPLVTQDVRALANHDSGMVLARSKRGTGTLKLETDTEGLRYSFQAPETTAGNDLLESIKRGDIDQSSFQFTVAPGGDKWEKLPDGAVLRTITKIEAIFDVSPVAFPAYSGTTVQARSTGPTAGEDPTVTNARRMFELLAAPL
ncbi:MAG: HK97 family phage prohead protease [Luteolibacter sp.]|uniref:HK97 family phage prohead protease n=1 Tax=Luteolibacter sp. TaxID=1962973 RepID=UPI003267E6FA